MSVYTDVCLPAALTYMDELANALSSELAGLVCDDMLGPDHSCPVCTGNALIEKARRFQLAHHQDLKRLKESRV